MYPADVLRVMIGIEQSQKGRNPPARRRVLTLARRKGARNHREECAINERIAVDEEESRAFRTFHEVNIKRPRPDRTRASKSCGDLPELDSYRWRRAFSARNSVSLGLVSLHFPVSS